MFSDTLPELLNANRFIDAQEAATAVLEPKHYQRLSQVATLLPGGQITLTGRRDPFGPRVVEGRVKCSVEMICQRCLETVTYELEGMIGWGLVFSELEMQSLDKQFDPILVVEGQLQLREAVEDELMLLLPMMPMHQACDSGWKPQAEDADASSAERESPFSVLSQLKNEQGS
jgi:Predicted metal-binding, possibly nucleic acid-binding protein